MGFAEVSASRRGRSSEGEQDGAARAPERQRVRHPAAGGERRFAGVPACLVLGAGAGFLKTGSVMCEAEGMLPLVQFFSD